MTESKGEAISQPWDMAKEPSVTAYMIIHDGKFYPVSKEVFDRYERWRARQLQRQAICSAVGAIRARR